MEKSYGEGVFLINDSRVHFLRVAALILLFPVSSAAPKLLAISPPCVDLHPASTLRAQSMRLAFQRRLILSQRGHEDFPPVGAFEGCDTFRGCCRRCVYIIEQQDRASLPVIRGPKSPAHGPATQAEFFRHYTCAYVDWVFVPFNLVVVRTIDWRRVGSLLLIVFVSILVSIITHADWQYHGTDGGHMIARHTNRLAGRVSSTRSTGH